MPHTIISAENGVLRGVHGMSHDSKPGPIVRVR